MIVWHDFNGVSDVMACLVGFSTVRSCVAVAILDAMLVMQWTCDIYIYFYLFPQFKELGWKGEGGGIGRGERGDREFQFNWTLCRS